jgi:hypothetical protein
MVRRMLALRTIVVAAAAGLSACAANPIAPDRAPIDYRGSASGSRNTPPTGVAGAHTIPAPVIPPRIVDMGASPTNTSAIDEARALVAEAGARPGGAIRQPRDSKANRTVEVMRGDTLYDISRRYSVNMRALIETNRLEPP